MDFKIEMVPSCGTVTIENIGSLTTDEAIGIYTPIRKAMLMRQNAAPTIVPKTQGKKNTITMNFLGGKHVDDALIRAAMDDFEKYVEAYAKSNLPIEKFLRKAKRELDVVDADIATVKPTRAWLNRRTATVPKFAVRVGK